MFRSIWNTVVNIMIDFMDSAPQYQNKCNSYRQNYLANTIVSMHNNHYQQIWNIYCMKNSPEPCMEMASQSFKHRKLNQSNCATCGPTHESKQHPISQYPISRPTSIEDQTNPSTTTSIVFRLPQYKCI